MEKVDLDLTAVFGEVSSIQKELNIDTTLASDIFYLRSRQRHTPELEKQYLEAVAAGKEVSVFTFGCTQASGEALLQAARNPQE